MVRLRHVVCSIILILALTLASLFVIFHNASRPKMKVQQIQSPLSVLLGLDASLSYFASARADLPPNKHTRIMNGTEAVEARYNYFLSLQHEWMAHSSLQM